MTPKRDGLATRRGDKWGDPPQLPSAPSPPPPPSHFRQILLVPAAHFLASVPGLEPFGRWSKEVDNLEHNLSAFAVPMNLPGDLDKIQILNQKF